MTGTGTGPGPDPGRDPGTGPDPGPAPDSDDQEALDPSGVLSAAVVETRVARRRRALGPVPGRMTAIVVAVAVVVGVGVVSLAAPAPPPPPPAPPGDGVQVAPATARTSSLFCVTGAGIDAGAGATGSVVLTNTTRTAVRGVMTTAQGSGAPAVRRSVTVPPLGSADVTPAQGLPAGATATTFTFAGGGVTGTMVVASPFGWSTAPCVSSVSSEWDFVGGSTATGLLDLTLYNPTAASAMVNVSFLGTDGNVLVPQAYQGITLTPGQLVVAGLGAYVQNQSVVATLVQTSSGAVVATELDRMAVKSGSGLALVAGTPAPATTWHLAQTTAVQGGTVDLSVANPGQTPVTAVVTVGLSSATVTPQKLNVPAHAVATLAASATAGWPLGSPYSITVTAPAPIVVGRSVVAPPAGASPQAGLTGGTVAIASSWLVVGPGSPGNPLVAGATMQTLAVANPGPSSVQVAVTPLSGGRAVAMVKVAPDGLAVFGPDAVGGLQPLVVSATGPVTVEVDDGPTGAPGIVSASGFPLGS